MQVYFRLAGARGRPSCIYWITKTCTTSATTFRRFCSSKNTRSPFKWNCRHGLKPDGLSFGEGLRGQVLAMQVLEAQAVAGGLIKLRHPTVACSESCGKVERNTLGCLRLINKDTEANVCTQSLGNEPQMWLGLYTAPASNWACSSATPCTTPHVHTPGEKQHPGIC